MKKMGIRSILLLMVGLSIGLMSITAKTSMMVLTHNVESFAGLLDTDIKAERTVERINVEFKRQVQEWKNVLLRGSNTDQRTKYWQQFLAQEKEIQQLAVATLDLLTDYPQLQQELSDFALEHQAMGQAYRKGYQAFIDSGFNAAVGDKAVSGIDRKPSEQLESLSNSLQALTVKHSEEIYTQSVAVEQKAFLTVLAIALIVLLSIAWLLKRWIIDPLEQTVHQIEELAQGHHVEVKNNNAIGEIGKVNRATASLSQQLHTMLTTLTATSTSLEQASTHISTLSASQATTAGAQQEQTSKVASAVERLAVSADQVASNAQTVSHSAQRTTENALSSKQQMQELLSAMATLDNNMQAASDAAESLSEQTDRVNEVMSVIQSIAEQTNLLALNAAIEAARAGDHGRGFAVVADEVRSLAQKTQTSTKEIEDIMTAVHHGSAASVEAMLQGKRHTQTVVNHIDAACCQWDTLASEMEHIRNQNGEVALAANEQTVVTRDIARWLSQLQSGADQQQQQATETNDASHQLNSLAITLTDNLHRYHTE
uniref:methyl-accepting chemotaxis protein n=1 Tax=Thaumasiovibrio occultus TaxID=1891184 RepID=UPI000B35C5A6|nr:methyl-accepting chemotaxis protein [Thaumasiovibrio occultus]